MKFTRIPEDTFKNIQLNAGIVAKSFNPSTQEVSDLIGATTGGLQFNATPEFQDFGEDIDNCPKNTKELKKLTAWGITLAGTLVTITLATAKTLVGAGDINGSKIVPRNDVLDTDFEDLWWIGDYSDVNTGANAGFVAIHMLNTLNTGGFQIQSSDKGKGNFAFSFEAHYSMNAQDTVPFEVYVVNGGSGTLGSILFDTHTISLAPDDTYTIRATTDPDDASITWASADTSVATVSDGVVTAEGAGDTIVTGTITVNGIDYNDTCTVIVVEG